jgi:hypothetical protein
MAEAIKHYLTAAVSKQGLMDIVRLVFSSVGHKPR